MTPTQRQNLARLTLYCASLPPDYAHFDMEVYVRNGGVDYNASPVRKMEPACGTSACFVGHGPHAGVLPLEGETWEKYVIRNFLSKLEDGPYYLWGNEFDWLFGCLWENSIPDAIKRAAWVLHGGEAPEINQTDDDEGKEYYEWDEPEGWDTFTPDMARIQRIADGEELSVNQD